MAFGQPGQIVGRSAVADQELSNLRFGSASINPVIADSFGINCYRNPFISDFVVELLLGSHEKMAQLEMIDLMGKQVYQVRAFSTDTTSEGTRKSTGKRPICGSGPLWSSGRIPFMCSRTSPY